MCKLLLAAAAAFLELEHREGRLSKDPPGQSTAEERPIAVHPELELGRAG
jgi:hypothetical protein